ncbi:SurA N-terminal domain-containing protein [Bradyrhizobium lablabi]|uniref:SurA N-terminal domain-containing protein n=1 Tax=Bradyrhizobium lablabi TaxID=722472 RepID=UPI00090BC1D0|nr:SurA N-terminal domain-containing protein [Bradyrhizobium lablabi]SHM85420.1 peptidyl-prolyl cis-trans isomerase, EpsD family [Bradyrhizobium lablabi]
MKSPNLALSRAAVVLGLCGILVAGCGKNSGEQAANSNSQVVAHVGDQVITAQEFENELRLLNIPPDKQKEPEIVKRVLNEMVTRKYLLAQALGAKLDREPNVLLDILRSREQVLANAFLSRSVAKKLSAISKADLDKYIADNPLKFAGRKLMTVDQIAFPLGANAQSIIDSTKDANSLEEVDQKLTALGIPHGRSTGTLNSSEIPDELMSSMRAKKPDDVFFVRSGQNGVFLKVKSEEIRPLEGEAALNAARQLMRNDFLKAESGMVSVSANLEAKYEGVYSKIMSAEEGKRN